MDESPAPAQAEDVVSNQEVRDELRRLTEAMEAHTKFLKDWRMPVRNGALAGLAGVLAATLGVSLLVQIFQPFKNIEMLRPLIEKVSDALDQDGRK